MRTLWLVVPDHVMQRNYPYFDEYGETRIFTTKATALASAERKSKAQNWPVHVLEASVIQTFPDEQTTEAAE